MIDADTRRKLIVRALKNGKPWTASELAAQVGCTTSAIHDAMRKLYEAGAVAKSTRKNQLTQYALPEFRDLLPKSELSLMHEQPASDAKSLAYASSIFLWGDKPAKQSTSDDPYERGVLDACEYLRNSANYRAKAGSFADAALLRNLAASVRKKLCNQTA